jgi:hypothetical protein
VTERDADDRTNLTPFVVHRQRDRDLSVDGTCHAHLAGSTPSQVRGSHGRHTPTPEEGPIFITSDAERLPSGPEVRAQDVKNIVLEHVFG